MTEKRLIVDDDYNWVDTVTDTVIEVEDAFDLVNELHEENEQLKQNCKNYEWYKQYKAILNENEKLKNRIKTLEDTIDGLTGTIAHFDMGDLE